VRSPLRSLDASSLAGCIYSALLPRLQVPHRKTSAQPGRQDQRQTGARKTRGKQEPRKIRLITGCCLYIPHLLYIETPSLGIENMRYMQWEKLSPRCEGRRRVSAWNRVKGSSTEAFPQIANRKPVLFKALPSVHLSRK
jgi:hypothetical protein